MENTPNPGASPGNKNRWSGCLRILAALGCLGVLSAGCVLVAAIFLLRPSETDLQYSGAPDPVASRDFEQAFLELGIEGVEVLVVPSRGPGGDLVVIMMDETEGFTDIAGAGFDGVIHALDTKIQNGNYDVAALSLSYTDAEGNVLFTMTTDRETVASYAAGEVSQREFMGDVELDPEGILDMLDLYNQEVAP